MITLRILLRRSMADGILAEMRFRGFCWMAVVLALVWLVVPGRAQRAAPRAPAGIVVGTVLCGDTQRPGRFASVTLLAVPADKPASKGMSEEAADANPKAAATMIGDTVSTMTMLVAQTGLDGTFTISNVPPGDYYVSPQMPGYVSPLVEAASATTGATSNASYAGLPKVHVEANQTVRADMTLDRGAAVNGVVNFDDGAPVGLAMVTVERAEEGKTEVSALNIGSVAMIFGGGRPQSSRSDDRGHFRISGIGPGDYVLKVALQPAAVSFRRGVMDMTDVRTPLLVYAPGTMHRKDAVKITLHAGEERHDINVSVDLSAMHSVSGYVASAVDHHSLNQGFVTLKDTADPTVRRMGRVDANGAFTVTLVPTGLYTLEVANAADTERDKPEDDGGMRFASTKVLKSYQSGSLPVAVETSDVSGLVIELKEQKARTVADDKDDNN